MRSDAFISAVSAQAQSDEEFETLKKNLPIGEDAAGNTLFAQKRERPFTFRHTCVAGGGKSGFIRRLLITASCLYEREEACFFILSPISEYGELLRLKSMDATVPYIRNIPRPKPPKASGKQVKIPSNKMADNRMAR